MLFMLVFVVMIMVMMVVGLVVLCLLRGQAGQLFLEGILVLHGLQDLLTVQFFPGSGDDGGVGIVLPQQSHGGQEFFLLHPAGTAEDDGGSVFDLVVIKLPKVLHVNLALGGVGHSDEGVQGNVMVVQPLHRTDDVRQLAYARGFNDDAVRVVLEQNLLQRLPKVTHQAAADAAGVHFRDLHPGVLQEPAVDANFTELIFDEHQLFPLVGFLNQFFDQCGFSGA